MNIKIVVVIFVASFFASKTGIGQTMPGDPDPPLEKLGEFVQPAGPTMGYLPHRFVVKVKQLRDLDDGTDPKFMVVISSDDMREFEFDLSQSGEFHSSTVFASDPDIPDVWRSNLHPKAFQSQGFNFLLYEARDTDGDGELEKFGGLIDSQFVNIEALPTHNPALEFPDWLPEVAWFNQHEDIGTIKRFNGLSIDITFSGTIEDHYLVRFIGPPLENGDVPEWNRLSKNPISLVENDEGEEILPGEGVASFNLADDPQKKTGNWTLKLFVPGEAGGWNEVDEATFELIDP